MGFTNEQLERYSRHIVLKGIGVRGQKKLAAASVLIIGAGGLGSPAAMYLAAAGVGRIGIADADVVELSNLQRQVIHTTNDIGKPKVESARETIQAINPDVEVAAINERVTSKNILDLISGYDFILDGTDNYAAKYLINDACVMADKPFTHAGVLQFYGELMTVIPHKTPCYRCLFGNPQALRTGATCQEAGVVGAVTGVIGSLEALEAIKYITGAGELCTGKLLVCDTLTMDIDTVILSPRKEGCTVCSDDPEITELIDYELPACDL